jgi:D-sedoheptulose 7-phosphate isomerase
MHHRIHGRAALSGGEYLRELRRLLDALDPEALERFADQVESVWSRDGQVLVFGNGGSALTASHMVNDLLSCWNPEVQPRGLRALSLCDNPGVTTALANDLAFEDVFLLPLQAYGRAGDLAVAISGSGRSPNVVKAAAWAVANGLHLVSLTGFDGGELGGLAPLHVNVPSCHYGPIEDVHLAISHAVSSILRSRRRTVPPSLNP